MARDVQIQVSEFYFKKKFQKNTSGKGVCVGGVLIDQERVIEKP